MRLKLARTNRKDGPLLFFQSKRWIIPSLSHSFLMTVLVGWLASRAWGEVPSSTSILSNFKNLILNILNFNWNVFNEEAKNHFGLVLIASID